MIFRISSDNDELMAESIIYKEIALVIYILGKLTKEEQLRILEEYIHRMLGSFDEESLFLLLQKCSGASSEALLQKYSSVPENTLRWAAHYGRLNIVKYLVEKGFDVNTDRGSPLIAAAQAGHLNVVKYLVEHGADIHVRDDAPLRMAKIFDQPEIEEFLRSV